MAIFLIQKEKGVLELEELMVEDLLIRNKYTHTATYTSLDKLNKDIQNGLIPIGTIEFVTNYLKLHNPNFSHEIPIEIPTYLQTDEFLKREYKIVDWQNIPRKGVFFLKDVSRLKEFSGVTNTLYTDIDELFNYVPTNKYDSTLVLDKTHLFQVSTILNIKTEYRVYVLNHTIAAISCYEGSPINLPDIDLLLKAIRLLNLNEKYLTSYTIDIAVGNFGTAILEIHNFTSVGLYNALWGSELLYGYVDGINYLLNDNTIKYLERII